MPVCSHLLRFFAWGIALGLFAGNATADDWTRFRGPNGAGVSHDKNVPLKFDAKESVLWKIPVGGGNSSPIVASNRLFLHSTSDDGTERSLACYDTINGKQLWRKSIKGRKVKIREDSSLASSTPVTDGKFVYISYWDGKDILLTAYGFNGEQVWQRNLGAFISQHGPGASPILYKDKLILANDMDSHYDIKTQKKPVDRASVLFALDKKTGQTVWEKPREPYRACYSAPFFLEKNGNTEMIVTSTTAITSYDPDTGNVNWSWKWTFPNAPLRTVASSAYINGVILACSGDGSGERNMVAVAMNGFGKDARPDRLWENRKEFPYVTCPLTLGDHVYIVNDSGLAGCYEANSGKKVWFERLPDAKFYASPLLIDGKIYVASEQGDVYVIAANPNAYQLLAKNALGERIRATPAVADGRLYIRGQFHLYCIGKK